MEFGRQIKLTDPINYIKFSQTVDMDGDGDLEIMGYGAVQRNLERLSTTKTALGDYEEVRMPITPL